ncbi:histidine phosphatase family protein [Thermodesulfatator atlanticus]|uniref:histidine phosphatase family protein n=1 Tax=Thermodesulfatator atlanticus TaxID=501497 RepID=UPI0003B6F844|nr:histidine phosphatase family protein [Thermodesulfatator atlanticus]
MNERIFIMRHGLTRANLENRFTGRTEEPLTPEGIRQAQEAGRLIAKEDISAIYASPLRRTMETAIAVRKGMARPLPIIPDPAFIEINIPPWEGKTKDEIIANASLKYEMWRKNPHLFDLPGCENLQKVKERVVPRALSLFARKTPVLIVTHMVVVRVLFCYFLGIELKDYRVISVPNARVFVVEKEPQGFFVRTAEDMLLSDVA